MLVVATVAEVRAAVAEYRREHRTVGFVPTMGYLHEGHLALVDRSKALAGRTVVSIFVNPLQFGPHEDLERYPRDLDRDLRVLRARGADLVFLPTVEVMYPEPIMVRVDPGPIGDRWEGAVRPGHFSGVLTVVAKLFHQIAPDRAILGQKDIQQVTLIRRMVRDLDWALEITVVPTARDADGLALSSRNGYLSAEQREDGLALCRALRRVEAAWASGLVEAPALEAMARDTLAERPRISADYIAVVDPARLDPVTVALPGTIVAVAARVGPTRLLDNVILGELAS